MKVLLISLVMNILLLACEGRLIEDASNVSLSLTDNTTDTLEYTPGLIAIDSVIADFNQNGILDKLYVYKDLAEDTIDYNNKYLPRTLTLLLDGENEVWTNDSLVLCGSCGGIFGDPFAGIEYKNDTLAVHHYGGSAWRWTIDQYFKYDKTSKDFYMVKESRDWFHATERDSTLETTVTEKKNLYSKGMSTLSNYD